MEKKNQILVYLFTAISIVSLLGFYNSYLNFFPNFSKFSFIIHIHFVAFVCWFMLIIVQPILIKRKKISLHRKIGKASYFLAPILVLTILIIVYRKTEREIKISENDAVVTALIGLLDAISFSAYYAIAMIKQKNTRWHVAFIIAATLIVFNPGMSRLANVFKPGLGLPLAVLFPIVVSVSIIMYERIKLKRPIFKSPYFLFFCCWIFEIIILITLPNTGFWKNLVLNTFN